MKNERIVIKVGSSSLVEDNGVLRRAVLNQIAAQIAYARSLGYEALVVTSGATLTGLGKEPRLAGLSDPIARSQMAAFIGQATIARAWEEAFGLFGITAGQILRTHADFANGSVTEFMEQALGWGFVPVINEDDTRSVVEIRALVEEKGDNDMLACHVARAFQAARVFLLTDVDGVFDKNPLAEYGAALIPVIARVDEAILALLDDREGGRPTGMRSKFKAADLLQKAGITAHIANASKWVIAPILEGKQVGTTFPAL